jgi:hypothetical protein
LDRVKHSLHGKKKKKTFNTLFPLPGFHFFHGPLLGLLAVQQIADGLIPDEFKTETSVSEIFRMQLD